MNGTYLYEAMGQIRSVYVEEAEKQPFTRPFRNRLLSLAATLVLVLGMSLGILQMLDLWELSVPVASPDGTPGMTAVPQTPPVKAAAADGTGSDATVNLFLHLVLPRLDELLAVGAVLVPMIALLRKKPAKTVPLVSFGLYLGYLLVCIVSAYVFVDRKGWALLQQEILPMLHTALSLLFVIPLLNGILYLPKRLPALVLAAAAVFLLVRPQIPSKDLIDDDAVVSVESETYGVELVNLMELSGGTRTAPCPSYLEEDRTVAVIHMEDGGFYELRYVLDLRFSFHPLHFGEDDAHYVLTRFNAEGDAQAAWELNWRFERLRPGTEVTP